MKTITNYHYLLLFLAFISFAGMAQNKQQHLDRYFSAVNQHGQFNGNILLAQAGKPVWQLSAGYADRSSNKENVRDSRFNLASISKLFTSTAILQLRDKGKFRLDEPVHKYLPQFPFKEVTIRHLLTHTSGLPDLELYEELIRRHPDTVVTNADILPELNKWTKGLYFKPGDQFRYCNTEYSLLALLVENVSNKSFQQYLHKNIFVPAGMKETYVSVTERRYQDDPHVVRMYDRARRFTDTSYVNVDSLVRYKYTNYNCSGTVGESGVISTTEDLLRFDRAFFSYKLLKQSSVDEALTPVTLNNGKVHEGNMDTMQGEGKGMYGLGWAITQQPDLGRSVGHGGFKFGLATYYVHHLNDMQAVITFDNTPGPAFGQIITSSYHIISGKKVAAFKSKRSLAILYGNTLVKEGADMAVSKLNQFKADTANYYLNEWEMDKVGGELFFGSDFTGHQQLGIEAFKLNTILFPDGYNTYDSYGEALRISGQKAAAILEYQKSVRLNPKNEGGIRALREMAEGK